MTYDDYSSAEFPRPMATTVAPLPRALKLIGLCSPAMGSGKSAIADELVSSHGFLALKFAGALKRMVRCFLYDLAFDMETVNQMVDGTLKETPIDGFQRLLAEADIESLLSAMLRELFTDLAIDQHTTRRMVEGDLFTVPIDGLGVSPQLLLYGLNKWVVDCLIFRSSVTPRWLQQSLGTEFGRDCIRQDLWTTIVRLKVEAYRIIGGGRDIVIDDMRFPNELQLIRDLGGDAVRVVRPGVTVPQKHPSEGQLDEIQMLRIDNYGTLDALRAQARTLATCPLR